MYISIEFENIGSEDTQNTFALFEYQQERRKTSHYNRGDYRLSCLSGVQALLIKKEESCMIWYVGDSEIRLYYRDFKNKLLKYPGVKSISILPDDYKMDLISREL